MTVRNMLPPIRIHPILYVFIVISFVTGTFIQLFIILSIVFIHEAGHFFAARWFQWRVSEIKLWVFGGVMRTDEHSNRPLYEDIIVTIAGPLQHIFIFLVCVMCTYYQLLSPTVVEMILFYNGVILLFNLLPIWPLDGGKLIFFVCSHFFAYRKAHQLIVQLSLLLCMIMMVVILFVLPFNLSAFLVFIFLFVENKTEWKQRFYVFMRFLINRYEEDASIHRVLPISVNHQENLMDVFQQFKRGKKHSIYINYPNKRRKMIDEMDCLRCYFHEKAHDKTIGEIAKYL
ncbi:MULTISPECIES: M50 family metallopeptidase [unclassified Virgibacillus]|uniref:M50 family metallopeptidase n=1 Tax=unclassified Virgibacillus TaxID=2620237 RepID=UPI0024DE437D|nr:M50 family metallopeptidase [Virgibacillus sp. LDC-1]